jgi:hypothetical protein
MIPAGSNLRGMFVAATSVLVSACSSAPPASVPSAPEGAAFAQIGPAQGAGGSPAADCMASLAIPLDAGASAFLPEVASTHLADGNIQVQCAVRPSGDTFDVNGSISLGASASFSITGVTNRGSSNVQITFGNGGSTFTSQSPCALDFTFNQKMDVSPGRIWAFVMCPQASDGQGHTCSASAEFVFENCDE